MKDLNNTYYDCKDELVFANLSAYECGREKVPKPPGSTRLRNCEDRFTAKNISFNTLQTQYRNQSIRFGNVSAELQSCRRSLTEAQGNLDSEKGLVAGLQEGTRRLEEKVSEQRQDTNKKIQGLRTVVLGLQRHLLCLPSEENCSQEAEMYTCIPSHIAEWICLLVAVEGQELFDLSLCPLMGDSTWSSLSLSRYIRENPRISAVLILIMILATIGGITILMILFWIVVCYRARIMFNLGFCYGYLRRLCRRTTSSNSQENQEMKQTNEENEKDAEKGATEQGKDAKLPQASGRVPTPPIDRKGLDEEWKKKKDDGVESEKRKAPLAAAEDDSIL